MTAIRTVDALNKSDVDGLRAPSGKTDHPKECASGDCLFEEFSRLLDKIAEQVGSSQVGPELSQVYMDVKPAEIKSRSKEEKDAPRERVAVEPTESRAADQPVEVSEADSEPTLTADQTDKAESDIELDAAQDTETQSEAEDVEQVPTDSEIPKADSSEVVVEHAKKPVDDLTSAKLDQDAKPVENSKPFAEQGAEAKFDHARRNAPEQSQQNSHEHTRTETKDFDSFKPEMTPKDNQTNSGAESSKRASRDTAGQSVTDLMNSDAEQAQETLANQFAELVSKAAATTAARTQAPTRGGESHSALAHLLQAREAREASFLSTNNTTSFVRADRVDGANNTRSAQNEPGAAKRAEQSRTKPNQARTLEKVQEALREVAKAKDGRTISVRLDPPNLGSVKIDVSLREGGLHARIVAESPAVTQLLRERSHDLQSVLRRIGLEHDQVSVSVGNEQRDAHGSEFDKRAETQRREQGGTGRPESKLEKAETALPSWTQRAEEVLDHWVA